MHRMSSTTLIFARLGSRDGSEKGLQVETNRRLQDKKGHSSNRINTGIRCQIHS